VTREEIEQRMDELAREYRENKDPEILAELFELARWLKELEH
jgi:FKBP-type peptidyl-prolyl cis-trans isomerase (trigger factor)